MRLSNELLISLKSQGLRARRLIGRFASELGFKQDGIKKIDVCANELIANLLKDRTRSGILCFRNFERKRNSGIELTTLIGCDGNNTDDWIHDLYSLKRHAADEVRIENLKNAYVVGVRKFLDKREMKQNDRDYEGKTSVAVSNHPAEGNHSVSHVVRDHGSRILLGLIDGGEDIDTAAKTASFAEVFMYENYSKPLETILRKLKAILSGPSAAEMSLARFDERDMQIEFAATGSLHAVLWKPDEYRRGKLVGVGGINHSAFRMSYAWTEGSILVVHSRDIPEEWILTPSQRSLSAQELANLIIASKKELSDATVMAVK